jgi:hypothetical protein
MAKKDGFEALMQVVAAEWCLGSRFEPDGEFTEMTSYFPGSGLVGAEEFVRWAFAASSVRFDDPAPRWQRAKAEIRAAFVTHMGGETVDAARLRWPESDLPDYARMPITDPEAFARKLTDEELQEEVKAREDWRDRLVAERELERRGRPPWLWAAALAWLVLLAWYRGWF